MKLILAFVLIGILVKLLFAGIVKRVTITLYCDGGCGWVKQYTANTVQDCVRLAREEGWLVRDTEAINVKTTGDGQAFCPICRKNTQG